MEYMEKGIISFRPTPEVRAKLEEVKEAGMIVSKWINEQIMRGVGSQQVEQDQQFTMRLRFVPSQMWEAYASPEDVTAGRSDRVDVKRVMRESESVSRLNLRKYERFKKCLEAEGLQFFATKVPEFGVVQMVAVNSDEANVEFQKFFTRDKEGAYVRTSMPLPLMRYDDSHNVAIICYTEPV
jgi:hypothetical protein